MTPDRAFELHPRLAADCVVVGDLPVSRLLLMNDRRFPWCILVPRRSDLTELHHLSAADRGAVLAEIDSVSRALLTHCGAAKINVGALGNLVAQLHIHVVGRTPGDAAWPGPVWGSGTAERYRREEIDVTVERVRRDLAADLQPH